MLPGVAAEDTHRAGLNVVQAPWCSPCMYVAGDDHALTCGTSGASQGTYSHAWLVTSPRPPVCAADPALLLLHAAHARMSCQCLAQRMHGLASRRAGGSDAGAAAAHATHAATCGAAHARLCAQVSTWAPPPCLHISDRSARAPGWHQPHQAATSVAMPAALAAMMMQRSNSCCSSAWQRSGGARLA